MASTSLQLLLNEALTASKDGDSRSLSSQDSSFLAFLDVSAIHASTTLNAKIQSSPDRINWFDVGSFTALVGVVGVQELQINRSVYVNIRAVVTLTGATQTATAKISFWYDSNR